MSSIAVIGTSCCFSEARSLSQLWAMRLAGRRSWSVSNVGDSERPEDTFGWLSRVLARALLDAGFPEGCGVPAEGTGLWLGMASGSPSTVEDPRTWSERRGSGALLVRRLCQRFDFRGGGYVLEMGVASSSLAIAQACSALAAGEVEIALVGGLQPKPERSVIASASSWELPMSPGAGCGFVVLMQASKALESRRRTLALIPGWGVASEGTLDGENSDSSSLKWARKRAHIRADSKVEDLLLLENSLWRPKQNLDDGHKVPAGSISENIGETGAACGIASLLAAVSVVQNRLLPPPVALEPEEDQMGSASAPRLWLKDTPCRVGVDVEADGCSVHLVVEGLAQAPRSRLSLREQMLLNSRQDAEVLLFSADHPEALKQRIEEFRLSLDRLSQAQLTDLAVFLAQKIDGAAGSRAACVVRTPAEARRALDTLIGWLEAGEGQHLDVEQGIFLGTVDDVPRVGLLFPGQGSLRRRGGGAWKKRFEFLQRFWPESAPENEDLSTELAQPAILSSSLAGLKMLGELGLEAVLAIGHSLGEWAALTWSRALDEKTASSLVRLRGQVMQSSSIAGRMYCLRENPEQVACWTEGSPVVIAAYNQRFNTVISGPSSDVENVVRLARESGCVARRLRVSHAFHTPLDTRSVSEFQDALGATEFQCPLRPIVSTVTGNPVTGKTDLRQLLSDQLRRPVFFQAALAAARGRVDLWLEVGPGALLAGLVDEAEDAPVISLDVGGDQLRGLLLAVGGAFALGAPIDPSVLFVDRHHQPFVWRPMDSQRSDSDPKEVVLEPQQILRSDSGATGHGLPLVKSAPPFRNSLEDPPAGIAHWLRPFGRTWKERPLPPIAPSRTRPTAEGWEVIGLDGPSTAELKRLFSRAPGEGVLLLLSGRVTDALCELAFHHAKSLPHGARLGVVQTITGQGWARGMAAAFRRAFPHLEVLALECPRNLPRSSERILVEMLARKGSADVRYDEQGRREEAVWNALDGKTPDRLKSMSWIPSKVGREVWLAFVGDQEEAMRWARVLDEDPGGHLVLAGSARWIDRARTSFRNAERLVAVDAFDPAALQRVVDQIERRWGAITRVFFAVRPLVRRGNSGSVELDSNFGPSPTGAKTLSQILAAARDLRSVEVIETLEPATGFSELLGQALGRESWRSWVEDLDAQSTLRARYFTGGEEARRVGREWLLRRESLARPGVGGASESLGHWLLNSLEQKTPATLALFDRTQALELEVSCPEPPQLRFLERIRVQIPGVEWIAEAELSQSSDPYLIEQTVEGEALVPFSMGLEAMAQVAMGLEGTPKHPTFEKVSLDRPITVPIDQSVKLRILALKTGPGRVRVVLRSSLSDFALDHQQADCVFSSALDWPTAPGGLASRVGEEGLGLEPHSELYGSILSQSGRFRRLRDFRWLHARECVAEIAGRDPKSADLWFGGYQPNALVMGDPALRESALQAIQVMQTKMLLEPVAVERILTRGLGIGDRCLIQALERSRPAGHRVYDVAILDPSGRVLEVWKGLRCRLMPRNAPIVSWSAPLLGPQLEERLARHLDAQGASVALFDDRAQASPENGLERMIVWPTVFEGCGGGDRSAKETKSGWYFSLARTQAHTLAVAGPNILSCDLEPVASEVVRAWRKKLGTQGIETISSLQKETEDRLNQAAARCFAATLCLEKAEGLDHPNLVLDRVVDENCVLLRSGSFVILSLLLCIGEREFALAFCARASSFESQLEPRLDSRVLAI